MLFSDWSSHGWSGRGSVVKVMDLHRGSTPAGTHMSHWWQQEGRLAKMAPVHLKSSTLHVNTFAPS